MLPYDCEKVAVFFFENSIKNAENTLNVSVKSLGKKYSDNIKEALIFIEVCRRLLRIRLKKFPLPFQKKKEKAHTNILLQKSARAVFGHSKRSTAEIPDKTREIYGA